MEVCLRQIYLWWICSDLVVVRLRSCVFGLDPSDLRYFSSAAVAVLGCWSYGALARRLPDCLLQQIVPDSGQGRSYVQLAGVTGTGSNLHLLNIIR